MGWGDELMVTGQVRELQRRDPRRVRIVYERLRWHEAWDHNPRIAQPGERGDFQELRPRENYLRPYIAAKSDEQWTWRAWGPPAGEIYFINKEREFGDRFSGRVLLEPRIKPGASPNKDWGREQWLELARLLRERGIRYAQMGPAGADLLPGAEPILTNNMRYAAAVMARARAAVLPEGGLHHVAAAVRTPAVVIFGGFIAPAVTGYAQQRSLFAGGEQHPLGCGMRLRCKHCTQAMRAITPEWVLTELEAALEKTSGHLAA